MNRKSQHGVALVITLIMLSMVTLMAVVFLAISRSGKSSVAVTTAQADARLMADAALSRAQAEIGARILTTTNPLNYDLIVSTNYINPFGFRPGISSPTNVSYTYPNGRRLTRSDRLQNLVNLQYDSRPPVYIQTNRNGNTEFRYYLDLNRNGRFETNGLLPVMGRSQGEFIGTNGLPTRVFSPGQVQMANFTGDPEWIGILEYPDKPHSDSNRFVGRYAFVVLPAGKSLDINHIHNNAKLPDPNVNRDGYIRNHGIGSWELNLAGFLRDLNTNAWSTYMYRTSAAPSVGVTFQDAGAILAHRYFDPIKGNRRLDSVNALFGRAGTVAVSQDRLDSYSDGPLLLTQSSINFDALLLDRPLKSWSGSPNPQGYYDVEELYNPLLTSQRFARRLALATTNSISSYDRYSFYRLLGQIGTDSSPAVSNLLYQPNMLVAHTNKLHLNYRNDFPNGQTNFIPWGPVIDPTTLNDPSLAVLVAPRNPIDFFYQAGDRLLRSNLKTNDFLARLGLRAPSLRRHFSLGVTPVRDAFSLTNIQIYNTSLNAPFFTTNNEYTTTTHRLLQVAANIYDSGTRRTLGTTNDYPSVFRPTFYKTPTNLIISGYVEEKSTDFLRLPWLSVEQIAGSPAVGPITNRNIFGIPFVIGTKQGYPNFNEASLQTVVQVSRKLEFVRDRVSRALRTNQMYVLGISNLFGVEAWNSYTQVFQRPLSMMVTNRQTIHLRSVMTSRSGARRTNIITLLGGLPRITAATITTNDWNWEGRQDAGAFVLPIVDNFTFLSNSVYDSRRNRFVSNNEFDRSGNLQVPEWTLHITNRLQYMLVDRSVPGVPRLVDFVNLDKLVSEINITGRLMGNRTAGAGGYFSDSRQSGVLTEDSLWLTNRAVFDDPISPPVGLTNQIGVALGAPFVGAGTWRSASGDPVGGRDKEKSIQKFSDFMRGRSTNLVMQAPFSPTRKVFETKTWQANDPLVHYTVGDLSDFSLTNSFGVVQPANNPVPPSNLGLLNDRYRPWGGNPNKQSSDVTAFRMTLKDPGVRSSDDWQFPSGKFANVGWLGRVHRGSPWQTLYLKSGEEDLRLWRNWSGSFGTHPTNDWKAVDLFTVAPNNEAARGLLSVNQTNVAAWSAVLSGVSVLSNSLPNPGSMTGMGFDAVFAQPSSVQLSAIVNGINNARVRQPNRVFRTMGDVLATPELTVASPFLNLRTRQQIERGLTDEAVERIPQQIMSLIKTDEPRMVVYSFGQSLKPAERSLVTSGSFYNICTNYQITGELVTKTVLRIEDAPYKPRTVVENFSILPPQ